MYLTRFRVNTARSEARRLIGSPHRLHGAVNAAFPEFPSRDGNGPRVLWRLDAGRGRGPETVLWIVSPHRPDLTHLDEQAGWPASKQRCWTTYDYGAFLDGLTAGSSWGFRLTANPLHYARVKDGAPTKRTAHKGAQHQIGWLLKHQERAGFAVLPTPPEHRVEALGERDAWQVTARDTLPLQFGRGRGEAADAGTRRPGPVQFTQATFDGLLRVTDPEALRRTLTQGLGKSKAYGCGLLTLSRLTTAAAEAVR